MTKWKKGQAIKLDWLAMVCTLFGPSPKCGKEQKKNKFENRTTSAPRNIGKFLLSKMANLLGFFLCQKMHGKKRAPRNNGQLHQQT